MSLIPGITFGVSASQGEAVQGQSEFHRFIHPRFSQRLSFGRAWRRAQEKGEVTLLSRIHRLVVTTACYRLLLIDLEQVSRPARYRHRHYVWNN